MLRRKIRDATQGGTLTHDEEFAMRLSANHALTVASDRTAGTSPRKSALPRFVASLLSSARDWLARRAVLAELHGLDERTRADLRIYPGDFQAIADGTYVREGGAHDVAVRQARNPPALRADPITKRRAELMRQMQADCRALPELDMGCEDPERRSRTLGGWLSLE
jgi:hypothetical protein